MTFRHSHAGRPNTTGAPVGYNPSGVTRPLSFLVRLINAKVSYHNKLVTGPFASLPAEKAKIVRVRREILDLKEEYQRAPRPMAGRIA